MTFNAANDAAASKGASAPNVAGAPSAAADSVGAGVTSARIYAVGALAHSDYAVGTLRYTLRGLVLVFIWLLWGDFCFQMMELVVPVVFPIYLLRGDLLGVSNTTANVLMVTIPSIFSMVVGPAVSFRSDRHRSRWGRRIPYMLWTAPLVVISLVGLGLSNVFAAHLRHSRLPALLHIQPMTATLMVIGFFIVLFCFANEFVGSVYWYLFADVVPEHLLGRFLGLFRVVSAGAGAVFNYYLFSRSIQHMGAVFSGIAALYGVGFTLMCLNIREGEYPPPSDIGQHPSILAQIRLYLTQCFSHPIYLLTFAQTLFMTLATAATLGALVFANVGLGLSMAAIGAVAAAIMLGKMVISFPAGWLADAWRPARLLLFAQILNVPAQLFGFLFLHGLRSYVVFQCLILLVNASINASAVPLLMVIFPKERYGQFASCNGMMKALAGLVGAAAAGVFIDAVTHRGTHAYNAYAYRWMYAWGAVFAVITSLVTYAQYAMWKRLGGDTAYVAPGSTAALARTGGG